MWAFDLFSIFEMFSKCSQWFNGRLLYTSGKSCSFELLSSPTAKLKKILRLFGGSHENNETDLKSVIYFMFEALQSLTQPDENKLPSPLILKSIHLLNKVNRLGIIIQRQTSLYTPRIDGTILLQIKKNESCNMIDNGISILFRGWNRNRINGWKYQTMPRASINAIDCHPVERHFRFWRWCGCQLDAAFSSVDDVHLAAMNTAGWRSLDYDWRSRAEDPHRCFGDLKGTDRKRMTKRCKKSMAEVEEFHQLILTWIAPL